MPKWSPKAYIILTKEQSGNSYIFWSMPVITFSQVANFGDHPLRVKNNLFPYVHNDFTSYFWRLKIKGETKIIFKLKNKSWDSSRRRSTESDRNKPFKIFFKYPNFEGIPFAIFIGRKYFLYEHKKMRKVPILTLSILYWHQNRLLLGLDIFVYLVFRVKGGSLELLYKLINH